MQKGEKVLERTQETQNNEYWLILGEFWVVEPGMLPTSQVPMFVKNTKSSQPGLGIVKHLPDLYTDFSQV